jgi:hypothetical protein
MLCAIDKPLFNKPRNNQKREPDTSVNLGVLDYSSDLKNTDHLLCFLWLCSFCGPETYEFSYVCPVFRLREADKKTIFSVLKKNERDKKKLLETVLKQLRQLALTAQQQ